MKPDTDQETLHTKLVFDAFLDCISQQSEFHAEFQDLALEPTFQGKLIESKRKGTLMCACTT